MFKMTLDTSELDNNLFSERRKDYAKQRMLWTTIIDVEEQLKQKMRDHNVDATYNLRRSLDVQVQGDVASLWGAEYAVRALETGQAPGEMPDIQSLKEWAAVKLGQVNAAYPVALKIMRIGTQRYIQGGPKLISEALEVAQKNLAEKTFLDFSLDWLE